MQATGLSVAYPGDEADGEGVRLTRVASALHGRRTPTGRGVPRDRPPRGSDHQTNPNPVHRAPDSRPDLAAPIAGAMGLLDAPDTGLGGQDLTTCDDR